MAQSQNAANNNLTDDVFTPLVTGDNTITGLPGIAGSDAAFWLYTRFLGTNVDLRYIYAVAHQGFGGAGLAELTTTLRNYNGSGGIFTFNSLTVNTLGQVIVNVTVTSGTYEVRWALTPLGKTTYL